jgi:hypothetical protein
VEAAVNLNRRGRVYVAKTWEWDRSIPRDEHEKIIDQALRLPAWIEARLDTQNLDVRKLGAGDGFYRLRVGAFRAVFQTLSSDVILHRVFRRKGDDDYAFVERLAVVRSHDGLRVLSTASESPVPPVPATMRPVIRPSIRAHVQNPLSVFHDSELEAVGIGPSVIDALRRVPPELRPDDALAQFGVDAKVARLVAELWERPEVYVGADLGLELARLDEEEAVERLRSDYSLMSLAPIDDPKAFLALLDGSIEDWMVYLHPSQLGAVRRSVTGPSRVRGGAGTGKTVVALHRARYLADETAGTVLLTTFVNTLPKVWKQLLAAFPVPVRGSILCRTVDQLARELYYEAGGGRQIADESQRSALIRAAWEPRRMQLGGLTELGLADEFDHMITGRSIASFEEYASLSRTGRGTPLAASARTAVWDAYEDYSRQLGRAKLTYWPELRRDALLVLRDGKVTRRYDAVVADEAQDLGQASVHLLAAVSGGPPEPNLTLVGDGQQSIYPGGFSLRQLGIEVRGRATVLRTNWRNTYPIWAAACAFVEGEAFDDLEDELAVGRAVEEAPVPMRDGPAPGLWKAPAGEASALAAEIVREALELGSGTADTVVLAPTNAQARALRSTLRAAGVPNDDLARFEGVYEPVVRVGTFHRAKGLEYKHVVVTGLGVDSWPRHWPGLDPAAREEARLRDVRAAFVAMTRARDRLDVVVAGEPAAELARAAWAFDQR